MTEPRENYVAGQVLLSYKDYIKKQYGQEGINNLKSALKFDIMQVTVERKYPSSYVFSCMDYIRTTYGQEELFKMGRFSLQNIGAKRYLTRFFTPQKILDRIIESLPKVNYTVKLNVEYMENGAIVTFLNPELNEYQCIYWHGMLQGVFDMTKTKGTIDVDMSRVITDKIVIYTMKW